MGLITEEVEVGLAGRNTKYYKELGYEMPYSENKHGNLVIPKGSKIKVKVGDLQQSSKIIVNVECDGCHKKLKMPYCNYFSKVRDGKIYCDECSDKHLHDTHNCNQKKYKRKPKQYKSEEERKEKTRNYPEYKDFVKRVLARDEYKCVVCGKTDNLEVHHLDGYNWCIEKRTEESNGVTLCADHHANFHMLYGTGDNTREQFEEWFEGFAQKEDYDGEIQTTRKVYLYEDDKVFDSVEECTKYLDAFKSHVYNACNKATIPVEYVVVNGEKKPRMGRVLSVKGKHVFWLDEYENMSEEEIKETLEAKQSKTNKNVICLNTGKVYECMKDTKLDYPKLNMGCLSSCCKGRLNTCGKDEEGTPLRWMYYEEYLENGAKEGLNCGTSAYRKVVCLETGKAYEQIKLTKNDYPNINVNGITLCCSGNRKTCGKDENGNPLHWMYYEDYIKQQENNNN